MRKRLFLIYLVFLIPVSETISQEGDRPDINPFVKITRKPFLVEDVAKYKSASAINKKRSEYSREDWQALIDARWGEGLPTEKKLEIFDDFWKRIDEKYSCFPNSEVNWDTLRQKYRPEIETGVSRGRFFTILSHMSVSMQEGHLMVSDTSVYTDVLEP